MKIMFLPVTLNPPIANHNQQIIQLIPNEHNQALPTFVVVFIYLFIYCISYTYKIRVWNTKHGSIFSNEPSQRQKQNKYHGFAHI